MIRNIFLVNFHFSVVKSVSKQGSSESNVNISSYTYQNIVELKRFENRLTEQHSHRI